MILIWSLEKWKNILNHVNEILFNIWKWNIHSLIIYWIVKKFKFKCGFCLFSLLFISVGENEKER